MIYSWRKASGSGAGNDCVEVTHSPPIGAIRDSKNPRVRIAVTIPALVTWIRGR